MKCKFLNVISLVLMAFLLAGCKDNIDIALITDMGTVVDGSFNQGSYEGINSYAEETGKVYEIYEPGNASTDCYLKSIKKAVSDGAEVIVCPDVLFEEAVYKAQKKYPYVQFILVDGEPHDSLYEDYSLQENTMPIMFSEEQLGFLAGYSAVRDGNTELGFIGGIDQEAIVEYGYGYVQGADYAAIEMGVNVNIKYCYSGTFSEDDNVKALAEKWYNEGTDVIFACGGSMGKSVMMAAENCNGYVIGVDSDQSGLSETVITTAEKKLDVAVYTGLKNYFDETFVGGTIYEMDAANEGIGLEMENSRFKTFSQTEYDAIYSQLLSGRIMPFVSMAYANCADLEVVNTTVDFVSLPVGE